MGHQKVNKKGPELEGHLVFPCSRPRCRDCDIDDSTII